MKIKRKTSLFTMKFSFSITNFIISFWIFANIKKTCFIVDRKKIIITIYTQNHVFSFVALTIILLKKIMIELDYTIRIRKLKRENSIMYRFNSCLYKI
jgi:hypothetical protein